VAPNIQNLNALEFFIVSYCRYFSPHTTKHIVGTESLTYEKVQHSLGHAFYGHHRMDVADAFNAFVTHIATAKFASEQNNKYNKQPLMRMHPLVYLMHTFTELCLVDAHIGAGQNEMEVPHHIPFVEMGKIQTGGYVATEDVLMTNLKLPLLQVLGHLISVLHWKPHTRQWQREERFFFPDADVNRHMGQGYGFPSFTQGAKQFRPSPHP